MGLEIFSLHTKLHGPATASPPTDISGTSFSMTTTATIIVAVAQRTLPSRCGVRQSRAANHPSHCPHATRPSPLCPRLSSAGRRPSAGQRRAMALPPPPSASPHCGRAATGKSVISTVSALCFLNNSALTNNIFKAKSPLKQGGESYGKPGETIRSVPGGILCSFF